MASGLWSRRYLDVWRPPLPASLNETAYYEVIALEPERLLVLRATTHFKYIAPRFFKGTRYEPRGEFRMSPPNTGST